MGERRGPKRKSCQRRAARMRRGKRRTLRKAAEERKLKKASHHAKRAHARAIRHARQLKTKVAKHKSKETKTKVATHEKTAKTKEKEVACIFGKSKKETIRGKEVQAPKGAGAQDAQKRRAQLQNQEQTPQRGS